MVDDGEIQPKVIDKVKSLAPLMLLEILELHLIASSLGCAVVFFAIAEVRKQTDVLRNRQTKFLGDCVGA